MARYGCEPGRLLLGRFLGSGSIPYSIPNSDVEYGESPPWATQIVVSKYLDFTWEFSLV